MQQNFEELLKKIEAAKKTGGFDLSRDEDLSLAIMNLLSIEEHLFFTGTKTGKDEYFNLLGEVRNARKELLGKIIPKHEGETWCITKHLLATTMRLIEVGTKLHTEGKKDEAKEMFSRARRLYAMFWGLRLKLINVPDIKSAAAGSIESGASGTASSPREHGGSKVASGKPWTLEDIVDRLVDCCDE